MKKLILSTLAIAALTFSSCSSSDDEPQTAGFILDPADFKGTITSGNVTLDAATTYNLTGALIVEDGAKLTVPAGTRIEASGGTNAYVAVAQGGQIFINGLANNPVVMTSSKASPKAGDWGGLVLCGKAQTNKGGGTASAEVSGLSYGGNLNTDNSGSIKYLRLEYTGAEFTADKQFNGLSLFGVGSGTTIEYVQSFEGKDDGVEFFGGTVSGKYLVSINSGDDGIDFADGWAGTGEFWYVDSAAKAGIEGSNNGDDGNATPTTTANISNISIINSGTNKDEGALYMKEGTGVWTANNIFISGGASGFFMKDTDLVTAKHIADGDHTITNVQFSGITGVKVTGNASLSFFSEGNNSGAGNGKDKPTWANGWTTGL